MTNISWETRHVISKQILKYVSGMRLIAHFTMVSGLINVYTCKHSIILSTREYKYKTRQTLKLTLVHLSDLAITHTVTPYRGCGNPSWCERYVTLVYIYRPVLYKYHNVYKQKNAMSHS